MRAIINADGTLRVAPESDLEAFALNCWFEKNVPIDWYDVTRVPPAPKIIIDLSGFADSIGIFVSVPAA
ncbi:hypothetical protein ADM96_20285 [Burkholderia sp. ST111]|nr:hypothetical protein ADM96_20285 [Burkholderia sp. ST111]